MRKNIEKKEKQRDFVGLKMIPGEGRNRRDEEILTFLTGKVKRDFRETKVVRQSRFARLRVRQNEMNFSLTKITILSSRTDWNFFSQFCCSCVSARNFQTCITRDARTTGDTFVTRAVHNCAHLFFLFSRDSRNSMIITAPFRARTLCCSLLV